MKQMNLIITTAIMSISAMSFAADNGVQQTLNKVQAQVQQLKTSH